MQKIDVLPVRVAETVGLRRVTVFFYHGRRSVGGQGDMFPNFLKWRGRSVFCPPTFSRVDIFVLMHNCTALITFTYIAVFVC